MNKLKSKDGQVEFIMKAGNDFVKSQMPLSEAQKIVDNAKTVETSRKFDGFKLLIDKTYYFRVENNKGEKKHE